MLSVVISVAPESDFLISASDSDVVQIHYSVTGPHSTLHSTAKVENWDKPVCS